MSINIGYNRNCFTTNYAEIDSISNGAYIITKIELQIAERAHCKSIGSERHNEMFRCVRRCCDVVINNSASDVRERIMENSAWEITAKCGYFLFDEKSTSDVGEIEKL